MRKMSMGVSPQQPKAVGGSLGPSNSGDNSPFANFSIPRGGKGGSKADRTNVGVNSTVGRCGGGKGSTKPMARVQTTKKAAPVSAKARTNGRNQSK